MINQLLKSKILIVCLFGASSFFFAGQAKVEQDRATSAANCIYFAAGMYVKLKQLSKEKKIFDRVVTEIFKMPFYHFDKVFLDLFVNVPSHPIAEQMLTDFKQFVVLYQFPWLGSEFSFKKMSFEQWKTSFEKIIDSYNSFVQGEKSKEVVRMEIINTMKSVTNEYGFKGLLKGPLANIAISRAVDSLLSMPIKTKQGLIKVGDGEVAYAIKYIKKIKL